MTEFFTSVGCMDGRPQGAIRRLGKKLIGGKPDTVTDAGIVGKIITEFDLDSLRHKVVNVSIEHHSSRGVIVWGHHDCAGNPVSKEQHIEDIKKSTSIVRDMVSNTEVLVYGVYVEPNERIFRKPKWKAEVVDSPTQPEQPGRGITIFRRKK